MARRTLVNSLWGLAGLVAALWLLDRLAPVAVPLLLGWFIAYVFDPVLDRLEALRIPRPAGIVLLLAALFVGLTAVVLLVVPALTHQVRAAAAALPGYVEGLRGALLPRLGDLLGLDVPSEASQWTERLLEAAGRLGPQVASRAAAVAGRLFANLWGIVSSVLGLALIPVFAFYLLLEFNGLGGRLVGLAPPRHRPRLASLLDRADEALGAFVRGQLTVCAVLAVVYSVGLTFTGIDMPWVVGGLSGLLFVVPYLGTLVGLAVGSMLALLKFHDLAHLLGVWAVFAVGQGLEGFVLTPRIVGDRVGLHPLAVIVALLVGGELFGVVGILLAVPGAAVLRVGLEEALAVYRASEYFRRGAP